MKKSEDFLKKNIFCQKLSKMGFTFASCLRTKVNVMGCFFYLLAVIGAILLFGPEVYALLGPYFTSAAGLLIIIVTFPLQLLLNYKDHRESEHLIELLQEADRADDQLKIRNIKERLTILEERIHKKTSAVVWTLLVIVIVLFTLKLCLV